MKLRYLIKRINAVSDMEISIPTDIKDLNLGQLVRMKAVRENDTIEMLSILTGKPTEFFDALTFQEISRLSALIVTAKLNRSIADYMSTDNEINRLRKPKSVTIGLKAIPIPDDLFNSPYYATRKAVELIKEATDEDRDIITIFPELIAHFMYTPFTELKYNEDRASEFAEVIKDISLTEGVELGNFILRKLVRYWNPKMSRYKRIVMQIRIRLILLLYRPSVRSER